MEEQYTFTSDYTADKAKRDELYELFHKVFGISIPVFRDFYQRGFWDPTYRPFSYFHGSKLVANVSMFTMNLILDGEIRKAAGVQSVMTHPDYRKRGLMTQLMRKMLSEMDQQFDLSLLQTDQPELYERFGYQTIQQYTFLTKFVQVNQNKESDLRKLNMDDEDEKIVRSLFTEHQPISNRFAPISYQPSFFLNMYISNLKENVYYSSKLEAILVYQLEGKRLKLYDVIAKKLPTLKQCCEQIPFSFEEIEFYFCPDRFEVNYEPMEYTAGDQLMARGQLASYPLKWPPFANF